MSKIGAHCPKNEFWERCPVRDSYCRKLCHSCDAVRFCAGKDERFQQYGATVNTAKSTDAFLQNFGYRLWPHDLQIVRHLTFGGGGFLNQRVYSNNPRIPEDLEHSIEWAFAGTCYKLLEKLQKKNFRRVNACLNSYPTAFPYGNGMVLHFYQQQESSTPKLYTKSLTRDLKLMYSRLTLARISINL